MAPLVDRGVDRRQFLKITGCTACAISGLAFTPGATSVFAEDEPNIHNMLVVGEQAVFLSHLPMFEELNTTKTAFATPHRFQVILEAQFTQAGKDVSEIYLKDRKAHPAKATYTLGPAPFVLSRLFTPAAKPQLTGFTARVVRGHLEVDGENVAGLEKTAVTITRVVHAREFVPSAKKPAELEYILFGKGSELLLAHAIFGPPDFDHVLSVTVEGAELKPDMLTRDLRVVMKDRKNVLTERLRTGQSTPASLRIGGEKTAQEVQLVAGREFYFEEGELQIPATMDPTDEEKKAAAEKKK